MVKVLVLFYSTYGHIWQMAEAIAEGARQVEGAEVVVKRVPETLPVEVLEKMNAIDAQKAFAHIPIATTAELPSYDAIIFGSPTRFGTMTAQLKSFLDATGGHWASGALVGKVGSFFTSSATQHGGNEVTVLSSLPVLLHHGMVYVGLPYSCSTQMGLDEIKGGSPYGCATIAGGKGERLPSDQEKEMARFQGKHVTTIAKKLFQ
ncbi:multimeric flavodoxin WrbA [Naegleria gruberi]|uniref:Multimeric flavodoxin WrbA n=1 Tax=Naegleria gruberi TaxID=5762 RepID=D2VE25_NAEGR|nr:multimeric flavodoxin WrbA [Naegleria gruberi]EFC45097.1 multimeric flavodoxin WrbA [Naegleria gruberi]|eukprot:XP_002677841.1 multimeric flavodoxin WrbA [Naegleria gruberi strain NEG-M]